MTYRYVLELTSGQEIPVSRRYLEPGRHVLGSATGADLVLPVRGVSRSHAALEVLADGGILLEDLESTNGVLLDGRPVQRAVVVEGQRIRLGEAELLLGVVDGASAVLAMTGGGRTPETQAPPAASTFGLGPRVQLLARLGQGLGASVGRGAGLQEALDACLEEIRAALGLESLAFGQNGPEGEVHLAGDAQPTASSFGLEGPEGLYLRASGPRNGESLLREMASLVFASWQSGVAAAPQAATGDVPLPATGMASRAPAVRDILKIAARVAPAPIPVLLLGESGAGKDVMARHIHALSGRSEGPFIAINCAALPRDLLEAELFGVERGAATGVAARPGVFEQAAGGTLFLDELGEMPADVQAKLLRVLESTRLYRVGGRTPVTIDVRFIAATNRSLREAIEAGTFRLDLYHRLAGCEIVIPSLRERPEDLPALARARFREALAERGIRSPGITVAALGALLRHDWPGNIRELHHEIGRATLMLESGEPLDLRHLSPQVVGADPEAADLRLETAVTRAERQAIEIALECSGGEVEPALALLGISRTGFYRKLRELGIERG